MKVLGLILLGIISSSWYLFSWNFIQENVSHWMLDQNSLSLLLLLAGMFVFWILFWKLLGFQKKDRSNTNAFSYTQQKKDSETDFFDRRKKYDTYEEDSEITKDTIDIILDKEEKNKDSLIIEEEDSKNDFSHFENIPDTTFLNVAKNIRKKSQQDLKLIEWVGPKIEELLNKAWIFSFKDLAYSDINTLKSALKKWWPRYTIHNPNSWPKQAKFAHKWDLEQLKIYQNKLIKWVEI